MHVESRCSIRDMDGELSRVTSHRKAVLPAPRDERRGAAQGVGGRTRGLSSLPLSPDRGTAAPRHSAVSPSEARV